MKKIIIPILSIISLASCEKNDEGYMYKAYHVTHTERSGEIVATDFFKRDIKDSTSAWEWYKTTDAYSNISSWTDTTWIEYYCTYEEWLAKNKEL